MNKTRETPSCLSTCIQMSPWVSQCSISLMRNKTYHIFYKVVSESYSQDNQKISTYLAYTVSTTSEPLCWNCEVICRRRIQRHQPKPRLCMGQTTEELPAWILFQWQYSPVLSCSDSNRSPRSATFVMFSLMMPTVSSIWAWIAAVFAFPWLGPAEGAEESCRGR